MLCSNHTTAFNVADAGSRYIKYILYENKHMDLIQGSTYLSIACIKARLQFL